MKTVRVGVVGTGWGELQIQAFQRAKAAQVTALCDVDVARLAAVAKRYGIGSTFADYRELAASDQIDCVSVAVPPDLHEQVVLAAIEAGKHILCEKPVALRARQSLNLAAMSEERGLTHAVDFEMRFLPGNAYAKELIDEGYLGPLHRVEVNLVMERPWGEHGKWAGDLARGGGVLMELGAHFIDALMWWFGPISAVLAGTRTYFPTLRVPGMKEGGNGESIKQLVTGDDAFWCVLQFGQGGEGLVSFLTGARHDPGWTIGVYGQAGSLVLKSGQLWGMREGDREMGLLPIPKRLELVGTPADPLMLGMARLIERVTAKIDGEKESLPFPTFLDAAAVTRVIETIRRASDERRWVDVE